MYNKDVGRLSILTKHNQSHRNDKIPHTFTNTYYMLHDISYNIFHVIHMYICTYMSSSTSQGPYEVVPRNIIQKLLFYEILCFHFILH